MERPTRLAAVHASVTHQMFTEQQLLRAWHRQVLGDAVSKTGECLSSWRTVQTEAVPLHSGETDLEPNRGTFIDCRQAGLSRSKARRDRARK